MPSVRALMSSELTACRDDQSRPDVRPMPDHPQPGRGDRLRRPTARAPSVPAGLSRRHRKRDDVTVPEGDRSQVVGQPRVKPCHLGRGEEGSESCRPQIAGRGLACRRKSKHRLATPAAFEAFCARARLHRPHELSGYQGQRPWLVRGRCAPPDSRQTAERHRVPRPEAEAAFFHFIPLIFGGSLVM